MAHRDGRREKLKDKYHGELVDLHRQIGGAWISETPSEEEETRAIELLLDRADEDEAVGDTLDVHLGLKTNRQRALEYSESAVRAAKASAWAAIGSLITAVIALLLSISVARSPDKVAVSTPDRSAEAALHDNRQMPEVTP